MLIRAALALLLTGQLAQACSVVSNEQQYAVVAGQLVYQPTPSGEMSINAASIKKIEDVDVAHFHRAGPRAPTQPESNGPWRDSSFFLAPSYYTDNTRVFYRGAPLINPPGTEPVNAPTFVQPLAGIPFAADASSLYYDGTRSDDNRGAKQVDIASLKVLDEYLLMDRRNLYHKGQFVGVTTGFQVMASKPYGNGASCFQGRHVIARNVDTVFVDGVAIGAHAATFKIKRWMPGLVLDFSDQQGPHTYRYQRSEAELARALAELMEIERSGDGFITSREAVFYAPRKGDPNTPLIPIPGVDPEHFEVINQRVATDGKHLYELIGSVENGASATLNSVTLDAEIARIAPPYALGKSTVYFIGDSGVQPFTLAGTFEPINAYFAHDEQHVYWFDGREKARRFATVDTSQVHLVSPDYAYSDLSTAEGIYTYGGEFKPMNTQALEALSEDYARDDRHVYYQDELLDGADGATFEVMETFAKDKRRAYYYGRPLAGADMASWAILDSPYSRDQHAVFFGSEIIPGADPLTFERLPLGDRWARDSKAVYYADKALPGVDVSTFAQLDYEYAKDAHQVFYGSERVIGADAKTFKVVDGKAFDHQRSFQAGQ